MRLSWLVPFEWRETDTGRMTCGPVLPLGGGDVADWRGERGALREVSKETIVELFYALPTL